VGPLALAVLAPVIARAPISAALGRTSRSHDARLVALSAANGGEGDQLGFGVAISGNTIVAGSAYHQVGANAGQGTLYVSEEPATGWTNATQTAELTAADGRTHDNLGYAVALAGGTIVASAPLHRVGGNAERGAAYVFTKPRAGWWNATQSAELSDSDGRARDHCGWGVALTGRTVAVGAPRHTVGAHEKQGALPVQDAGLRLGQRHPERRADGASGRSAGAARPGRGCRGGHRGRRRPLHDRQSAVRRRGGVRAEQRRGRREDSVTRASCATSTRGRRGWPCSG
jgi:FG-GAP repeat